ncbi:Pyruvate kinase-like, insert domain containing protein [Rhypophila decipiens]
MSHNVDPTPAARGGVTPHEDENNSAVTPELSEIIGEVRFGKMKLMPGLRVESAIDKQLVDGPVQVGPEGIEGDEHDYTFHGGPEKAVHAYYSGHYPLWQAEYPSAANRFIPGGFGENLVLSTLSERNVCIGDIYSVGPPGTSSMPGGIPSEHSPTSLLLQISLPRQPCFKLNHRFQLKNFAPTTYKLSRTGWYFRVLRTGLVDKGYEIRLIERKHPRWTIERIQEYLHRQVGDIAMNEELSKIPELGTESRGVFLRRVEKQRIKERKERAKAAGGGDEKKDAKWRDYRIVEKKSETETGRIMSFVLEAVNPLKAEEVGQEAVDLDEGAHVKLKLPNGLVRAYSIAGGTDKNRFQLGVAYDKEAEEGAKKSRGGSRYLHLQAKVGDVIKVGAVTAGVPIVSAASNHVFVVGGIGITAFLALAEAYKKINYNFSLHYAVRSEKDVPFRERLMKLNQGCDGEKTAKNLIIYDKSKGQRLDIAKIVDILPWNSQLYFCGPKRMMDAALSITSEPKRQIGQKDVHFEAFEAEVGGDPFEVVVTNRVENKGEDGKEVPVVVSVGEEETLLEKLQERFGEDEVASSCCVGNCGTCVVRLVSGQVDHRGTALTKEETSSQMLSCVSRGIGRIAIEI